MACRRGRGGLRAVASGPGGPPRLRYVVEHTVLDVWRLPALVSANVSGGQGLHRTHPPPYLSDPRLIRAPGGIRVSPPG
ncbi:hypothetical protein FAGKG844_660014 [Frankia sp. AgKG'84/4]